MAPLTQAEIKTKLLKSTATSARQYEYTNLLGFRKRSKRNSRRGVQGFTGIPGNFYNESKDVADVISGRYRSLTDLHEKIKTQDDFKEQEVEDLIDKYGPVIWNDGASGFVTETDDQGEKYQSYPRYLIYADESDRIKIRTYTYCLVLQCTFSKMRGRPAHNIAVPAWLPHASSHSPEIGQSNATSPGLDTTSVTSFRSAAINTMSSVSSGGKRPRDANYYHAAVAQMVPNTYTGGASSSSVMPQSTAAESAFTMRNSVTDADEDGRSGETACSDDPRIPTPPLEQVPSPNSDQEEEIGGRTIHNKRPRYEPGGIALTNFRLGQLHGSARRTTRLMRRDYSSPWVGSDRPPVTTIDAGEPGHTEPAPDSATNDNSSGMASVYTSHDSIDTAQECDNDVIVVTSVQEEQNRLTPSTTPAPETRNEEESSVQNSPRPSPAAEDRDSAEPTSLIVTLPLKDQTQVKLRDRYRACLALALLCALDLQTQHTQILEDTITLITEIRSPDTTYNLLLDQWLSLVAIYLSFRRATDFHDTQAAWNAHLFSLSAVERLARDEPHRRASVSFQEWRLKNPSLTVPVWSRDITCALLEMVQWPRPLWADDVQEINRRVLEFNFGLMAWLGGSSFS